MLMLQDNHSEIKNNNKISPSNININYSRKNDTGVLCSFLAYLVW